MFRTTLSKALDAVQANKGLFSYKPVKPIDTLVARSFLELFLHFSAFVFFSAILLWCGYTMSFEAIPQLIGLWILLYLLSFSMGLVFMVLGDISPEVNKFISTFFSFYIFIRCDLFNSFDSTSVSGIPTLESNCTHGRVNAPCGFAKLSFGRWYLIKLYLYVVHC